MPDITAKVKEFDKDLDTIVKDLNEGWDQAKGIWAKIQKFLLPILGGVKFNSDEKTLLCVILDQRINTTKHRNDADPKETAEDVADLLHALRNIQTKIDCV